MAAAVAPRRRVEVDVERFVRRLGEAVQSAMETRQSFLTDFARLDREPGSALRRAGQIGVRCAPAFDAARWSINNLTAPRGAEGCRDALVDWIDLHIDACDLLMRAAGTGQLQYVTEAAATLRRAHIIAERFNRERRRLATAA